MSNDVTDNADHRRDSRPMGPGDQISADGVGGSDDQDGKQDEVLEIVHLDEWTEVITRKGTTKTRHRRIRFGVRMSTRATTTVVVICAAVLIALFAPERFHIFANIIKDLSSGGP